jgi:MoaA/NifB/PqqE/SkfB family radical SAM enzyme
MQLRLSKNIEKLIHDATGYMFSYKDEICNRVTYHKINQTAYEIMSLLANGNDEKSLTKFFQEQYKQDLKIEEKISSFFEFLKKLNLLTFDDYNNYKPKIIENLEIVTPKYCIIEISSNCLLNCAHCYLGKKENKFIETKKVLEIIDELSELGVDYIQLTGGEPFLHPDFIKIVSRIAEKNIRLAITTSGFLPEKKEENLAILKKINCDCFLQVSIDGIEQTHDSIRGKKSYKKTIDFIKHAVKLNIPVNIATVVQKKNINEIEQIVKNMKLLGVKKVRLSPLMEQGYGKGEEIVDNEIIKELVINLNTLYRVPDFEIIATEESVDYIDCNKSNCGCGSEILTIDPELNIYSCLLYRKPFDNLTETKLTRILRKYSVTNYNLMAPNKRDCFGCEKIEYCKGCITLGKIENNKKQCKWGKRWSL